MNAQQATPSLRNCGCICNFIGKLVTIMTATKIIILGVISYTVLFLSACMLFGNLKFTRNDAAGNGLEKGLTFVYGLGVLFLLAIILTLINIYFFSNVTQLWVKCIAFIPLLLPTFIFFVEVFHVGKQKESTIEEQAHRLTIEIKTATKLENARLLFRASTGSSNSKLKLIKEPSIYLYETSNAIFNQDDRSFYVYSDEFKTAEYLFDIPYKPEVIPFTDWQELRGIKTNGADSVMLEFRYKITE